MKYVMIAMISMLTFVARAGSCPTLAGSYTCSYQGIDLEVNVTERARTGYISYVVDYGMGAITIHPDSQPHFVERLPGVEKVHKYRYRGSCNGNAVTFNGTGELVDGTGVGAMTGSVTKQGAKIIIAVGVQAKSNENVRLVCN